jgi:DNA repair exonuclease SbcCD ATPase subunit
MENRLPGLRTRRDTLEQELADVEASLRGKRDAIEAIEAEAESETGGTGTDALSRKRSERNDVRARIRTEEDAIASLEAELEEVAERLDDVDSAASGSGLEEIETALSDRPEIDARREAVAEELRAQRARIDELERDLVGTFNEVMQHVLDTLEYGAVERIWLERRSTGDRAWSTEFELHVVRASDDGAVYEDTVDSLSKSERDVIGLVVALAGYLAHDVGQEIPFVVVDAVEMFDADRIRGLVEHFAEHARYVVAAILPEEQTELDGTYETVSTASFVADS